MDGDETSERTRTRCPASCVMDAGGMNTVRRLLPSFNGVDGAEGGALLLLLLLLLKLLRMRMRMKAERPGTVQHLHRVVSSRCIQEPVVLCSFKEAGSVCVSEPPLSRQDRAWVRHSTFQIAETFGPNPGAYWRAQFQHWLVLRGPNMSQRIWVGSNSDYNIWYMARCCPDAINWL